jgi:hypothetical protein
VGAAVNIDTGTMDLGKKKGDSEVRFRVSMNTSVLRDVSRVINLRSMRIWPSVITRRLMSAAPAAVA